MFRKQIEYPDHQAPPTIPDLVPVARQPNLKNARILVVDDEADARQMIALALQGCGAQVETAYNAEVAVNLTAREKFDAIVTDLAMPGGDGFSLLKRIRFRGDHTPAIVLSAMRGPEIECQVADAGFAQHLDKPLELSYLTAAVADLVNATQNR